MQQSVEKSLKSILVKYEIPFPHSHSIYELINLIEKNIKQVPENIHEATVLSPFAVVKRYPGDWEPISKEDYLELVQVAENVYHWVEEFINNN